MSWYVDAGSAGLPDIPHVLAWLVVAFTALVAP